MCYKCNVIIFWWWYSSNIELSGLSIVVTCDIHVLVYQCVTKSCDSPDWLVQPCIIRRHHVSLERFYDLAMCKTFQKCFNVEKINIQSFNTIVHYIRSVVVWLLKACCPFILSYSGRILMNTHKSTSGL